MSEREYRNLLQGREVGREGGREGQRGGEGGGI